MSSSMVQICNLALLKFGDLTITQISSPPANKEERACSVLYPMMRDLLLSQHPWNFAMQRADITPKLTTAPVFPEGWYAYALPADCLRVWEFYGSKAEWIVEGNTFLTAQEEEIYIRYIAAITETGRFSPSFVNCLATLLGSELAVKLGDDKAMRSALLAELKQILLPQAFQLNAIEGNRPQHTDEQPGDRGNYTWQTEGH